MSRTPKPKHTVLPYPRERQFLDDAMTEARNRNTITGLIEFDVTEPRRLMKEHEALTGEKLSFTFYLVRCLGKAIGENKSVVAYRQGKNKLIIFDDVGISTVIEGESNGRKRPMMHQVKSAHTKSFREIQDELTEARKRDPEEVRKEQSTKLTKFFLYMPGFMRRRLIKVFSKNPFLKTARTGTVLVTALGMMGPKNRRAWPIIFGGMSLTIGVGTLFRAPGLVGDSIEPRDYLALTMHFDHDVIDGAPAARFVARLAELLESGFELPGGPTEVDSSVDQKAIYNVAAVAG